MKRSFGKVIAEKITVALNGKKNSVQLRQAVTTIYESARAGNSANDTIFDNEEFDFAEAASFESSRVAFMDAPLSLDPDNEESLKQVQERLDKCPNARLYRTLSLKPILTSEQKSWMMNLDSEEEKKEFLELIKNRQRIIDENEQPVLYKGQFQYGVTNFSATGKEDVDTREEESTPSSIELIAPSVAAKEPVKQF